MELTLDQALQKGAEAHRAGKIQEADRYYTAILKANPKHSDANHNMGVLAVGIGKVEQALPFFKSALETNASKAQYWLSYINALIRLDRMVEAKAVLEQAKSKGAKGDGFDQIEKKFGSIPSINANIQDPSKEHQKSLVNLFTKGQYQETLKQATKLLIKFPESVILYNITGAVNERLGNLEEAIEAIKKGLSIKPDYAEGYNILGSTLKKQGKLDEAVKAYKNGLSIKPDYAEIYNNMGVTLLKQGQPEEAKEALKEAVAIMPDFAAVYWNLSGTSGNIRESKKWVENV